MGDTMEIGKLSNEKLQKIILNKIEAKRDEVILKPTIGEDCGALDFGEEYCVISTDPITGTENKIGVLAVNVALNDIAASGAVPIGIMVTMLIPPNATESDIDNIMDQLSKTASQANIDIIGGHTEITDAVNRFVICVTAVGKTMNNNIVKTSGAKPGDDLVLTKYAGLEGTSIIAYDNEQQLISQFGLDIVKQAQDLIKEISVIKEGMICAEFGVNAMHDVTEGGVLGAIWEMCHASNIGAQINKECIPILKETKLICDYYDIDPLKLISSGSMLISTKNGNELVKKIKQEGINAAIIGTVTENKTIYLKTDCESIIVSQPKTDELYKVNK